MSTIDITLPDALKRYLDEQVTRRGYQNASEYLESLLEADRLRELREELELTLAKRVDGPFSPLTPQDFEDIRKEGRRILAERKRA